MDNRPLFKAPSISPMGFLMWAATAALAYLVAELFGLRDYTSILSGTSASGEAIKDSAMIWGGVYVLLYFGFVLAAPILTIAAALMAAFRFKS